MERIDIAFFDVDETVVDFKSMFSFLQFYLENQFAENGRRRFDNYLLRVKEQWQINIPRETINREYYAQFKGAKRSEIAKLGLAWFVSEQQRLGDNFYIKESIALIDGYQRNGIPVVFVSGSMLDIITPIAQELKVDNILATRLYEDEWGLITGEIIPPQTIGQGKAQAVAQYIIEHDINPLATIAYGDHESDFSMLATTTQGVIISADVQVIAQARAAGFSIIERK